MAVIKKFRIKSFKNINSVVEFENILKADVVEINVTTKDTKIFMYKDNKKVNIKSKD